MSQLTDPRTAPRTAASSDVLVFPADPAWDAARRAWNLAVDQRPAVVALPRTVADVVDAVDYARTLGLRIAVQGTGHGAPGRALDDTMLVNTSRMTGAEVDPGARTARVAAGTIWADVVEAAVPTGSPPCTARRTTWASSATHSAAVSAGSPASTGSRPPASSRRRW